MSGEILWSRRTGFPVMKLRSCTAFSKSSALKRKRFIQKKLLWREQHSLLCAASSSGTRLHRGYVEEAAPEDTPPETTHLVFVVHGIGQKMDQGRIIRNTSMSAEFRCLNNPEEVWITTEVTVVFFLGWLVGRMRDAARKMEERHFSDRTTEHVEFLPVEWRSKLCLDGGMLHAGRLYCYSLRLTVDSSLTDSF